MKILILGGGKGQVSAIKKAKEMGHTVIVSDYYPDAPGKRYADFTTNISTFDIDGNIEVARKYEVDGIMTTATDQPVLTAATTAAELGLPFFLTPKTARAVTNKRDMKYVFDNYNIPTVKYKIIGENFARCELSDFSMPVVVKPLDSQGQRGVFKLHSIKEVENKFSEVVKYSRESEILVEEYYENNEITVSGWVKNYNLKLLTVTDRIAYERNSHLGICSAHIFPSRFLKDFYSKIKGISERIVEAFAIKNGPIYFQFLVGEMGIKVNEIACRIGGAYEGDFMPSLTGVDILKMRINLALNEKINYEPLEKYNLLQNKKWLSVQLFYAEPGTIREMTSISKFKKLPGVTQAGFNFGEGEEIENIKNATARAGYFIIIGESQNDLKLKIKKAYDTLKIKNGQDENLVIRELGEVL